MKITEKDFTCQVIDLAHVFGWRVAHFRAAVTQRGWATPVQADGAGFPDLVLVRGTWLIFAELKSAKGKLTDDQQVWLTILEATGNCEVYTWRPDDFDLISEILR